MEQGKRNNIVITRLKGEWNVEKLEKWTKEKLGVDTKFEKCGKQGKQRI